MKRHRSALSIASALTAALLVVPLSACATAPGEPSSMSTRDAAGTVEASPDRAVSDSMLAPDTETSTTSIIYSGDLSMTVTDPDAATAQIAKIVKELGGSIESQTVSAATPGTSAGASIGVRVPADKIDQAFDELAGVGEVTSQSRSSADVTTQRVDLQARLKALEDSITRLTELMSGAATTSELIEAESALAERQQELDGLRAQLAVLEDQIEDASIWVTLSTHRVIPGGPANFWEGLLAGVNSLGSAGAGALVVVGILLPWAILGGIIAYGVVLIVRVSKKRRRRQASAPDSQLIQ